MPYKDPAKQREESAKRAKRWKINNPEKVAEIRKRQYMKKRESTRERRDKLLPLFNLAHLHGDERRYAWMKLINLAPDAQISEKLQLKPKDLQKMALKVHSALRLALMDGNTWKAKCRQCEQEFNYRTVSRRVPMFCSKSCAAEANRRVDIELVISLYRRNMSLQKVAAIVGCHYGHVATILKDAGEPMRTRTNVEVCVEHGCGKPAVKKLNVTNGRMSGTRCERHLKIKRSEWSRNGRMRRKLKQEEQAA